MYFYGQHSVFFASVYRFGGKFDGIAFAISVCVA